MTPGGPLVVAYVDSTGDLYGGAEVSLYDIVTNLDRRRFQPVVVVPFWGDFAEQLACQGIPVIDLKERRFPGFSLHVGRRKIYNPVAFVQYVSRIVLLKRKLLKVLNRESVTLIHGNSFSGNLFGGMAAAQLGLPFVAHLRELEPDDRWGGWVFRNLIRRFVIENSTQCIAISEAVKHHLVTPRDRAFTKVTVRHDPLDTHCFQPDVNLSFRCRQMHQIPVDAFVIGMVGRFVRWKGQLTCLDALDIVRRRASQKVVLAFVGDEAAGYESYVAKIKQKITDLNLTDSVVMLGFQQDMPAIYSMFDVAVAPSHAEPLGRVVLEAMAMQKPVVATAVGGPAEIITHGVDGFLAPPKNAASLADRILELMDDPQLAKMIAMAGRRKVVEHYSIEAYIQFIASVYEMALRTSDNEE